MLMKRSSWWVFAVALTAVPRAHAQFAVIDASSVAQLIHQAQMLAQQLMAAKAQLAQVEAQYQAMIGNRGMQSLLGGTVRNYLPADWSQLSAALTGSGGYGSLSASFQGNLQANAVLSAQQISALPPDARAQINAARQSVALLQA